MKARIGIWGVWLAATGLVVIANQAEARASEGSAMPAMILRNHDAAVVLGTTFRNGDYVVVDGVGMVIVFDPPLSDRCLAATARELGLGGSAEYVGAQVSLAIPWWWRPSLGWMFDVHDAADNHVQVGLGLWF